MPSYTKEGVGMRKICLVLICCFFISQSKAQFLNSIGATAGITYGNQRYDGVVPKFTDRSAYLLGYNGALFFDLVQDKFVHWHLEFQYNQKGGVDGTGLPGYSDKLTYLSCNNYFKVQFELLNIIPYFFVGPNLDYLFQQNTVNNPLIKKYELLHVGAAVGAGFEFVSYGPLKFLTEGLYNPDILPAAQNNDLKMTNHDFQLRIGLRLSLANNKRKKDLDCNSPVYVPDY